MALRKSYSRLSPHYYLLPTTYYLLPTTYFNSYFLSFFSPFPKNTLTNFNIHTTCFVNYKGPASAENTHNFSFSPNNFSDLPSNFSYSPSNFTDFQAKNGIKTVETPRFTEESPRLYYKDTKNLRKNDRMRAKCDKWLVYIPFLCYPAIFLISAEIAVYGGYQRKNCYLSVAFL